MVIQNYFSTKSNHHKCNFNFVIHLSLILVLLLLHPKTIISHDNSRNAIAKLIYDTSRRSDHCNNNVHNVNNKRFLSLSSLSFMKTTRQRKQEQEQNVHNLLSLSGGSQQNSNKLSISKTNKAINNSSIITKNISIGIVLTTATLVFYLAYKQSISEFLSHYSALFKNWLQVTLLKVNGMGNYGLIIYTMAFAIWELLGQTTCPVETAAGMAFGVKRGVIASSTGRFLGAMLAFAIGRYTICYTLLQNKVLKSSNINDDESNSKSNNKIIKMANKSLQLHPYRTCLVIRYSCFPEIMKNFGLSILDHITPFLYASTMLIHAVPFTTLWTLVGHEASLKLSFDGGDIDFYQPNKILPWFLLFVPVFGIVGSPAIFALWINSMMKYEANEDKENSL